MLDCLTFSDVAGGDRFGGASGERVRSRLFGVGSRGDFTHLEVPGDGERSLRFFVMGDRASLLVAAGVSSGGVSNRRFLGGDLERVLDLRSTGGGGGLRSRRSLEVFFKKSFAVLGDDPSSEEDEDDRRRSLDTDRAGGFFSTGRPSRISR